MSKNFVNYKNIVYDNSSNVLIIEIEVFKKNKILSIFINNKEYDPIFWEYKKDDINIKRYHYRLIDDMIINEIKFIGLDDKKQKILLDTPINYKSKIKYKDNKLIINSKIIGLNEHKFIVYLLNKYQNEITDIIGEVEIFSKSLILVNHSNLRNVILPNLIQLKQLVVIQNSELRRISLVRFVNNLNFTKRFIISKNPKLLYINVNYAKPKNIVNVDQTKKYKLIHSKFTDIYYDLTSIGSFLINKPNNSKEKINIIDLPNDIPNHMRVRHLTLLDEKNILNYTDDSLKEYQLNFQDSALRIINKIKDQVNSVEIIKLNVNKKK